MLCVRIFSPMGSRPVEVFSEAKNYNLERDFQEVADDEAEAEKVQGGICVLAFILTVQGKDPGLHNDQQEYNLPERFRIYYPFPKVKSCLLESRLWGGYPALWLLVQKFVHGLYKLH